LLYFSFIVLKALATKLSIDPSIYLLNLYKHINRKQPFTLIYQFYIEEIIRITSINPTGEEEEITNSMNLATYPFRMSDIELPQDQTGYVYFFMSHKDKNHVEIGSTMCIRTTVRKYNSGAYSSIPIHLRPFALIAYICGFGKDKHLMEYVKNKWIEDRDANVMQWAKNARNIIRNDKELKLIYLLK
jgi:hypothetical protein